MIRFRHLSLIIYLNQRGLYKIYTVSRNVYPNEYEQKTGTIKAEFTMEILNNDLFHICKHETAIIFLRLHDKSFTTKHTRLNLLMTEIHI